MKLKMMSKLISVLIITVVFMTACGAGGGTSAGGGMAFEAPAAAPAAPMTDAASVVESPAHAADGGLALRSQAEVSFDDFYMDVEFVEEALGDWDTDVGSDVFGSAALLERMVVRTASLFMETDRFDYTVSGIERTIDNFGGFIENSSRRITRRQGESFWHVDYVLRVPVDHFDTVNRYIMTFGDVVNFSTTSEDVTLQFQDITSRLRIREEEERRLLTMIENTDDLSELIRLETRLANLRIIMERYTRRMTELDHLASFSTIHLSLSEVSEKSEIIPYGDNFFVRMTTAFDSSIEFSLALLEGIAILAATLVLPLVILAVPVLIGLFIIKKARRRTH